MKIAMVGPFGLHPKQTMRSRALQLAQPLAQYGHEVCLFMPPWHTPEEAGKTWTEDKVCLRYVPLGGGPLGITRRLIKEVLAWQPEIVYGFKPKAYSGLVLWWLWQFRRNQLQLVTDSDDWEGWGGWNDREAYTAVQKKFFAWQEKWGMTHCHTLTVASRALETIALSMGISPEQVVYLPNGPGISASAKQVSMDIEKSRPFPASHSPTILIYSRVFEFDLSRLLAILQGVKTAVPGVHFLFVGAGLFETDTSQLRQQFEKAGLMDSVTEAGWVVPEKLPDVLTQADVGLYLMEDSLLNRTKCPVKLADMLALGIPVVGEAVGQVSEYVLHGRTGLLRPSGDIAGLIQDLTFLLQSPVERQLISQAAAQHIANHFNWEKLAGQLELVFSKQNRQSPFTPARNDII